MKQMSFVINPISATKQADGIKFSQVRTEAYFEKHVSLTISAY